MEVRDVGILMVGILGLITLVALFGLWIVGIAYYLDQRSRDRRWFIKLIGAALWLPALSVGLLLWPVSKTEPAQPEAELKQ